MCTSFRHGSRPGPPGKTHPPSPVRRARRQSSVREVRVVAARAKTRDAPSWPWLFAPHVYTAPCSVSPTLCAPAAAIAVNVSTDVTVCGVACLPKFADPIPSAPRALHPNAKSAPSLASASVCSAPTATSTIVCELKILCGVSASMKSPVPSCPHRLLPHAYAAPCAVSATAWSRPATTRDSVPVVNQRAHRQIAASRARASRDAPFRFHPNSVSSPSAHVPALVACSPPRPVVVVSLRRPASASVRLASRRRVGFARTAPRPCSPSLFSPHACNFRHRSAPWSSVARRQSSSSSVVSSSSSSRPSLVLASRAPPRASSPRAARARVTRRASFAPPRARARARPSRVALASSPRTRDPTAAGAAPTRADRRARTDRRTDGPRRAGLARVFDRRARGVSYDAIDAVTMNKKNKIRVRDDPRARAKSRARAPVARRCDVCVYIWRCIRL